MTDEQKAYESFENIGIYGEILSFPVDWCASRIGWL